MHIIPRPKSFQENHLKFLLNHHILCNLSEFSPDLLEFIKSDLQIKDIELTSNLDSDILVLSKKLKPEEYEISIDANSIVIKASTNQAVFYAIKTLKQLRVDNYIVGAVIHDYPDISVRGLMQDISRAKVPTLKTLKEYVDLLSNLKFNHFELYVEGGSFEYLSFPEILADKNYIKQSEIKELIEYASKRYIDLVPNQNGFGHMSKWLELPKYKELAECIDGFDIWGSHRAPSTLDPTNKESFKLVKTMYSDMIPLFSSPYFNMNFDEPYELGHGKSKEQCLKTSKEDVYIDYLLPLYRVVKKYKKTPLIWGDVLINHSEVFDRLPKDLIVIDWGYNLNYDFAQHAKALSKNKVRFMMAPGTCTWSVITMRYYDMIGSIKHASSAIKENAGEGLIVTDWGDIGHLQYLPFSYPGIIYAASCAWSEGSEDEISLYLERLVGKTLSDVIISLGKYTTLEGEYRDYGSRLFSLILWAEHSRNQADKVKFYLEKIKPNLLDEKALKALEALFNEALLKIKTIDTLVKGEVENSINLLLTLIDIQRNLKKIINENTHNVFEKDFLILEAFMKKHQELWNIRNIEPGFIQSSNRIKWLIEILTEIDERR